MRRLKPHFSSKRRRWKDENMEAEKDQDREKVRRNDERSFEVCSRSEGSDPFLLAMSSDW